jgi:uncharacterized protein
VETPEHRQEDVVDVKLTNFVAELPAVDVHEHHMPSVLRRQDVGLMDLLSQSYAGWTQNRPYALPSEQRGADPMLTGSPPATWPAIQAYVEGSGSSSFVRNLIHGISELYDLGPDGITQKNWAQLDAEIRRRHRSQEWVNHVLDRAGIRRIITDPFEDPMMDCRASLGARYRSVIRINALAVGYHPGVRDHNGNSAHAFAERMCRKLRSFEDFLGFCEVLVDTMADRHQVAIKNALAYDRGLNFDDVDKAAARRAWGQADPDPAAKKAFGDVVVDHLCRLAGERDIPVQMHLGSAIIRSSHPMQAAGLIERHPKTRFLLMHLAYPWSQDLFGMAFVYRNVWLDLTWSFLLSPSRFVRDLHEAIEILPDESRLMFGGDNWHAEETYATIRLARRLIGQVLSEKVQARYFTENDARRLARKIFSENAVAFFRLEEVS